MTLNVPLLEQRFELVALMEEAKVDVAEAGATPEGGWEYGQSTIQ